MLISKFSGSLFKLVIPVFLLGMVVSDAIPVELNDRPLAFVRKFKPDVKVTNQQIESISKRGEALFNGDTLRTDDHGFALVQFMDKSLAKVKPESQLLIQGELQNDTKQNATTRISLEVGEIFLNVTEQGGSNFEVATSTSVASVKGTRFGASFDSYFWVTEGIVEVSVSDTDEIATLTEKMYAQVLEDGTIETGELSDEEIERREQEYTQLEGKMDPDIIRLRFIDEDGEEQVIELKVFEN